jgi:mono/diheme cytochrome c family protein
MSCIACHTKHDGELFAGGLPMPTPFGTLYSPNITPDAQWGIGKWSADVLARGHRVYTTRCATCHLASGLGQPPGYPPFAQVMTDEDIAAVVTYIRVAWGNHGGPVTTGEVNLLRAAPLLD